MHSTVCFEFWSSWKVTELLSNLSTIHLVRMTLIRKMEVDEIYFEILYCHFLIINLKFGSFS